jgi:hypothetical protein
LIAVFVSLALGARAALVLSNSFAYPDGGMALS